MIQVESTGQANKNPALTCQKLLAVAWNLKLYSQRWLLIDCKIGEAYARQPLKKEDSVWCYWYSSWGLKVSRKSSMQYWLVGLENAHVYTFSLLRVWYQTLSRLRSLWRALEQTIPSANVTSLQSAQLFL